MGKPVIRGLLWISSIYYATNNTTRMSLFKGLLTLLLLAAASASTMTTTEFEVGEEAGTIFQPKTSSGLVDAIEMVEKTQPVPANAWKTHTAPVPGSNHAEKVTNMNMDDAQAKQP